MTRSFLPVGQGAFYTERFCDGSCIIYDCGTSTNQKHLRNIISNELRDRSAVRAVFISHLHHDHISGLKFLLDNYNVERVILPAINEEERVLLYASNCLEFNKSGQDDDFVLKVIIDSNSAIHETNNNTRVIYVNKFDRDYNPKSSDLMETYDNIGSGDTIRYNATSNGQNHTIKRHEWVYIPYNYIAPLKDSLSDFFDLVSQCHSIDKFKEHWDNTAKGGFKEQLRKAYKSVYGSDLNKSSLVLYSGPNLTFTYYARLTCLNFVRGILFTKPGCLYTGDFDISNDNVYSFLKDNYSRNINKTNYWKSIGMCQIPHHGSDLSFNDKLLKNNFAMFVISVGSKNGVGHPGYNVLRKTLMTHSVLHVVNEHIYSAIRQYM